MSDTKIIPFESAAALCAGLRQQGRRIVLCHGIFDLLHPGYIVHLEEARALGDVLVVSLTADKFVNKGPGRPFCKEALRARTLAALACVDYVVVTAFASASAALEAVRPAVYCLGKDYERNVQKNDFLQKDLATAAKVGAEVRYAGFGDFQRDQIAQSSFRAFAGRREGFLPCPGPRILHEGFPRGGGELLQFARAGHGRCHL